MKLSVILLDAEATDSVHLLTTLSYQGMLHECLIVDAGGVCHYLHRGELERVDLGEHLAGRRLSLVRIIRFSLGGSAVSPSHFEVVAALEAALSPVGVRVERASIVMSTGDGVVSEEAFPQYWNYNLLIEPADMAGENGFAVLPLRDPERLLVVGVAMVALCGGLWRWLDSAPLDGGTFRGGAENDAVPNSARVRVVRATTRMVDAGDVASQAVAWALAPGVQFPPPPNCVRHAEPREAVALMAEQMTRREPANAFGFAYQQYTPPPPPAQVKKSPFAALAQFLGEFWKQVRSMPSEFATKVWAGVKARVEQAVTERTYGHDADIKVTFDTGEDPELALDVARRASRVASLPDLNVTTPPPSPKTWSMLTAVVLGAADGLDLPDEARVASPVSMNQRAVITELSCLVHPSLASPTRGAFVLPPYEAGLLGWDTDEPFVVPGTDVDGTRALLKRIDDAENGRIGADPAVAESATDPKSSEGTKQKSNDKSSSKRSVAQPTKKELQALRQRVTGWSADREHTLMWRIATAIMRQQDLALSHLTQTAAELERIKKEMEQGDAELVATGSRFKRRAKIILFALLALIGIVTLGIAFVAAVALIYWVGAFVLGLIGLLWSMIRTAAHRVRLEHRLSALARRPAELIEQRRQAADEYVRLASLYAQLQDWAEILAVALHRPLGHLHHAAEKPWATDVGALSFVSGVPELDEGRVRAITLSVMQHLSTKGWISSSFEWQRTRVMEKYNALAGGVVATDALPEADTSEGDAVIARLPARDGHEATVVYSARANLRREISAGAIADEYRASRFDAMHQAVAAADPFSMIRSITCDVPGLNEPPRGPQAFLTPIVEWTEVPRLDGLLVDHLRLGTVQVGSIVGITDGLEATLLSQRLATVPVNPIPDRFTLAAFRLDVSDPVLLEDVKIIHRSGATAVTTSDVAETQRPPEPEIGEYG